MKFLSKLLIIGVMFGFTAVIMQDAMQRMDQIEKQKIERAEARYRASDAYIRMHTVMLIHQVGFSFSFCSGVMVQGPSGKFYILTASHCADDDSDVFQVLHDEMGRLGTVKIVAKDVKSDLLLLSPVPRQNMAIPIAKSMIRHDAVRAFGYGMFFPNKKSTGELLRMNNSQFNNMCANPDRRYMISSLKVIRGDSGGPVVNSAGELVGIMLAYPADYPEFSCLATLGSIQRFMANK